MRFLRRLLARAAHFATARRSDRRLREEIEEHIALQTEENLRAGMPAAEARRQAVLKFGAVEAVREHYHAEHSLPVFENLAQDLVVPSLKNASDSPENLVRRNWILGVQLSARVLVEVIAGADRLIQICYVDMLQLVYRLRLL